MTLNASLGAGGWTATIPPVSTPGNSGASRPSRIAIIEADCWTDYDDYVSMRVALWAEKVGAWDIAAISVNTYWLEAPAAIDSLCCYDGRIGVPLAICNPPYVPTGGTPGWMTLLQLASVKRTAGFPGTLPDSVTMYRTILANADRPVEIISLGYMNNLQALLQSPADSISSLTGAQLVAQKVAKLWCMGGEWPTGSENNFNRDATASAAANYVVSNWPTAVPIYFLGFSIANQVWSAQAAYASGDTNDPLYKMMTGSFDQNGGHQSWDPMAVLMAAYGDPVKAGYALVQGTASVNASTGANSWTASASGPHYYVTKVAPDSFFTDVLAKVSVLSTQPAALPPPPGQPRVTFPVSSPRGNIGAAQPAIQKYTAGVLDDSLFLWWSAADMADRGDGNNVQYWADRKRRAVFSQATSGSRPVYRASKNGKPAAEFTGAQRTSTADSISLPGVCTVYVKAQFDVAPAGTQTMLEHGNSANTFRGLAVQSDLNVASRAVSYTNASTAVTDDANAVAVDTGSWNVHTMVRSGTTLEEFYNNVGNGSTALARPNSAHAPVTIGGRAGSTAEYSTCWISEVRIYSGAHNSTQRAAVIADMA